MKWPIILRVVVCPWPTRDDLASVALIASIAGAAVMTGMLCWAMAMLDARDQSEAITNIAYGLLATVGMVIASLGLAITKRSIEAEFWKMKFKASGGDEL